MNNSGSSLNGFIIFVTLALVRPSFWAISLRESNSSLSNILCHWITLRMICFWACFTVYFSYGLVSLEFQACNLLRLLHPLVVNHVRWYAILESNYEYATKDEIQMYETASR
jgi:hypothetical protein